MPVWRIHNIGARRKARRTRDREERAMKAFRTYKKRMIAAALAAILLLCCAAPALADTFSAIVTAKTAAVYANAALGEKLGSLNKSAVVRVSGYSNTIAKISYKGHIGYMKISALKRVEDVASKAVANAAAPVYRSADTTSASVRVLPPRFFRCCARHRSMALLRVSLAR